MKKILYLLIIMVLLVGCSDAYANVSNPKEDVISIGDSAYTKSNLFNLMINQDPASLVVQMAKQKILEKEMPVTDDVTSQAKEELEYVKTLIGDDFLTNISLYGFASEQDYLDRALIPAAQEKLLIEKYIGDNLDLISTKYSPKKVRVLEFDGVDSANTALAAIKDGESVDDVAKKYSTSMTYNGTERLVHIESTLPEVVKVFVNESSTPTLTSQPLLQESTSKYYVVQIIDTTASRFKEETIKELSSLSSINELVFENYFIEGEFAVYDKAIYDSVVKSYPNYLK